jgi:hypothetical protein
LHTINVHYRPRRTCSSLAQDNAKESEGKGNYSRRASARADPILGTCHFLDVTGMRVFVTRRRILFLGILTRRKTSEVSRPHRRAFGLLVRQPIDSSKTRATTLLSSIFVLARSLSFCGSEYDDFSSSSGRRFGTHD